MNVWALRFSKLWASEVSPIELMEQFCMAWTVRILNLKRKNIEIGIQRHR